MGPMGAGKTTFIAHATGEGWAHVEHSLVSRPVNPVRTITCYSAPEGLAPVTFVDTPGFEDTEMSEVDGLCTIAEWLKNNLKNGDLAGIVFVYRISDNRMSGSLLKNIQVFVKICGMKVMKNVVVATTMWKNISAPTAWRRQAELERVWFRGIMNVGCELKVFEDSYDSAWAIVNDILNLDPCPPLLIQEEILRGKKVDETSAGKIRKWRWGVK
ncbi:hypothetical protein HWV62_39900 [Athelia sp. TMB]|nr:hypothetical protein HWV62_39900 [Athelia sp. TMB]